MEEVLILSFPGPLCIYWCQSVMFHRLLFLVRTCWGSWWCLRMLAILGCMSVMAYNYQGLGFTYYLERLSSKKRMLLHLKWNLSLLSFTFSFLHIGTLCMMFFHGLHHCHHSLQSKCHHQCQIHFTFLWIFHLFFSGTYHQLRLLQMVVFCICTCQIDKKMSFKYNDFSLSIKLW